MYLRHKEDYKNIGQTWKKLFKIMAKNKLLTNNYQTLAVAYNDPEITPKDQLLYDTCIKIDNFKSSRILPTNSLKPGKYIVLTYRGSNNKKSDAYKYLFGNYLIKNSFSLKNEPCIEFYRFENKYFFMRTYYTEICDPIF